MDNTVFVGEVTEWELKKRLDLIIQKLQKQKAETGHVDLEITTENPIDDLLNNLAYRWVDCGLPESVIKREILKIMEQKPTEEFLEESIRLDESCGSEQAAEKCDTSFNFDDTMEEMEKLLREGLGSGMGNNEGDKCADKSDSGTVTEPQESDVRFEEVVDQNVSAVDIEQLSCDYSKNFENEQYNSPSTSSGRSAESAFKLPVSSCSRKRTPVANKLYKDIVSPVAFYIKNSGVTPVRQHLKFTPEKHLYRNDLSESVYCPSVVNNYFPLAKDVVLPEVCYMPAGKKIISQEHCRTKMPNSINKLVGDRPEIIIHERRISKGERKPNAHTMNPNHSVVSEDISIYVTKQAEIH